MERHRQKTLRSQHQQRSSETVNEQLMDTAATIDDHTSPATSTGTEQREVRSAGTEVCTVGETTGTGGADDHGLSLLDDVECKFNVNSYQMVFVVNTESFLYRRNSLSTARQVHHLMIYCQCSDYNNNNSNNNTRFLERRGAIALEALAYRSSH